MPYPPEDHPFGGPPGPWQAPPGMPFATPPRLRAPAPPPRRNRRGWLLAGAAVFVLAVLGGIALVLASTTGDGSSGIEDPEQALPTPTPSATPTPSEEPGSQDGLTGRVTYVVDGDTLDVEGLGRVRVLGIDTPEHGECGFDEAKELMEDLVLNRTVSAVPSPGGDDADRYGRYLRYVDVGATDAGLREIEAGLAVARYDSTDGYDAHPREAAYHAADDRVPQYTCPAPS